VIEKNLGNIERLFRLACGILLLAWAFTRPHLNGVEWFVIIISTALVLNGIFCRCYLWYVLNINTSEPGCSADPGCT
jgi:DUF2892 family protein